MDLSDKTTETSLDPGPEVHKNDSTLNGEPNFTESKVNLGENNEQKPSKRSLKKKLKIEQWEIKKKIKRKAEREKQRQKKIEAQLKGEDMPKGPSRKALKHNKVKYDEECPIRVAIDLSFDKFMIDKDICKCVKQMLRIYTINRRSEMPVPLYFCSLEEKGKTHSVLERHDGYQHWDVKISNKPLLDCFEKDKIVYLTSESENVLTELKKDHVFVIGGLVDHNQHKGMCYEKAKSLGIQHARLPLDENIIMKSRRVLTIDHVFEILLRVAGGALWPEALLAVLPMRKGATPLAPAAAARPDSAADQNDSTSQ